MKWLVLAAASLIACGDGHSYVEVTVTSALPLTLRSLEVDATNAGMSGHSAFSKGDSFSIPPDQSFALQVDGRTGDLDVEVTAIGTDATLAHARDVIPIVNGGTARLTLALTASGDGGAGATCSDNAKNGDETGIDCGGSCSQKCSLGSGCGHGTDCVTGYCSVTTQTCGPAHCADTLKDSDEIDVDCGGSCAPCDIDRACSQGSDCISGNCVNNQFCALASGTPGWLPAPGILMSPSAYVLIGPGASSAGMIVSLFAYMSIVDGNHVRVVQYDSTTGAFDYAAYPVDVPNSTIVGLVFDAAGKLYTIGGGTSKNTAYSTTTVWNGSIWMALTDLPGGGHAGNSPVLGVDGLLYSLGGEGPVTNTGDLYAFDTTINQWSGLGYMQAYRYGCGAAATTDHLYCIGGAVLGGSPSDSMKGESFSLGQKKWTAIAPMSTTRSAAATVRGPDGRIYMLGGSVDGTQQKALATVEAYSPGGDHWAAAASMKTSRLGLVAGLGTDGRIYAFGGSYTGTSGAVYPSDVEVYGPVATIQPTQVVPGGTVTIGGGNFAANARVDVHLEGISGVTLGSGMTDGSGALGAPVVVAAPTAPGAYHLTIVDSRSRYPVTYTIEVQ